VEEGEDKRFENVPSYVRELYPIHATHKCCVSSRVLQLVLSDAISGKSFDEIGQTIGAMRLERYLSSRVLYDSELLDWKKQRVAQAALGVGSDQDGVELQDFSDFEDPDRYNETYTIFSEFLIALFTKYITTHFDEIDGYADYHSSAADLLSSYFQL